tara:strand:- start:111 stop:728 length:618 start_codon:yes stop_codon:yes gene_type:complete
MNPAPRLSMVRTTAATILRENEAVTRAAEAFGIQNNIATTQTISVQGWERQIPEVNGVYTALLGMQKEGHERVATLIGELESTVDGRRKGELRREINTKSKTLELNRVVLNALIDKRAESTKATAPTLKAPAEKAVEPEAPVTKKVTPAQVKKAASKRTTTRKDSRRATFERMSFKEVQQAAKKRNFSAQGSKEAIINRILKKGD